MCISFRLSIFVLISIDKGKIITPYGISFIDLFLLLSFCSKLLIFNHFSQNILITTRRVCEVAVNQSIEVGQSQGLIKELIAREICKMFN